MGTSSRLVLKLLLPCVLWSSLFLSLLSSPLFAQGAATCLQTQFEKTVMNNLTRYANIYKNKYPHLQLDEFDLVTDSYMRLMESAQKGNVDLETVKPAYVRKLVEWEVLRKLKSHNRINTKEGISLDQPLSSSEENSGTLMDVVADSKEGQQPEEMLLYNESMNEINKAIQKLVAQMTSRKFLYQYQN